MNYAAPNEKGISANALFGAVMIYIVFIGMGLTATAVVSGTFSASATVTNTTTVSQSTNATANTGQEVLQTSTTVTSNAWPIYQTVGAWILWLSVATGIAVLVFKEIDS